MKCVTLPDTCVEILPIPFADAVVAGQYAALNSTWRRLRATPLKLHVGGLDAAELTKRRAAIGGAVVNPMFPERLRHLEADIVATPSRPNFPRQQNNLIAVWPPWEQGFGDAFGGTLLPLGELSRLGELRKHALAISGLRHASLVRPLAAAAGSLCALERPQPPLLPRCASACWPELHVCMPRNTDTRDAYEANLALDAASGWLPPPAPPPPPFAAGAPPPPLRVLIAARTGRRPIVELDALVAACDGSAVGGGGVVARCEALPAGASVEEKARRLRRADVLVSMWGGDTINGLRLKRGGAVIEVRNAGFVRGASWGWVELHRRWVTRTTATCFKPKAACPLHLKDVRQRPLAFYTLTLPENATVLGDEETRCLERAAAGERGAGRRHMCFWNAGLRVDAARLKAVLGRVVADRERGLVPVETRDVVCEKRKHGGVLDPSTGQRVCFA